MSYAYDKLNRITNRTVTNGTTYSTAYTYVPGSSTYGANATTPLVATITQGSGANAMNFAYTYDNRGNITSETRNGVTTTYEYDALGQLTRVNDPNDPTGSTFGTTWIYSYDRGGNILNKSAYVYTTGTVGTVVRSWAYGYDDPNWKDKLTSFDGHTITYDTIGNPLNDGEWTYEWQAGRQLKRMTNLTTGVVMEFTYNHAGIRTKKVKKENGVAVETTEYILNGKNVVGLIHTNHDSSEINRMHFYYDAQDRVVLAYFNGTMYSYVYNQQGDMIGILDECDNMVAEYMYDAWGKITNKLNFETTKIGEFNPFRYRGYVWDQQTKLYYLRSRYYAPDKLRYISADNSVTEIYVYCSNNPTCKRDDSGYSAVYSLEGTRKLHDVVVEKVRQAVNGYSARTQTGIKGAGRHGGYGYPDVIDADNHAWDIKFNNTRYGWTSGHSQIERYTDWTGYTRGYPVIIAPFDYELDGILGKVTISNGSLETGDAGIVYYEFQPYTQDMPVLVPEYDKNYAKDEAHESNNVLNYIFSSALLFAALLSPLPGDEVVAFAAFIPLF